MGHAEMAIWNVCDRVIRCTRGDGQSVEITAIGWETTRTRSAMIRPGRALLTGRARRLTIPGGTVAIDRGDGSTCGRLDGREVSLAGGTHAVHVAGSPSISCAFAGRATVRPGERTGVSVAFDGPRPLTLVADATPDPPPGPIVLPRSLDGVAAGLSCINASMDPPNPDRSWPARRPRPPSFTFEEDADLPRVPGASHPVRLAIPRDVGTLLVCAPLAFYLGLPIELGDTSVPVLVDPEGGWRMPFPEEHSIESTAARWLRRNHVLDSHVRAAGPFAAPTDAAARLQAWGIDAEDCYTASLGARLRAYHTVAWDALADVAPEWPLATYLAPALDAAIALPYALDRLGVIGLARSTELGDAELVERSLDAYYRAPSPELRKPKLLPAGYHAWFAPGVPIDAFTTDPRTVAREYVRPRGRTPSIEIALVLNDQDMAADVEVGPLTVVGEESNVPVETTLYEGVDRTRLRQIFQEPIDFVHFIGHCDVDGLRCPDGGLSLATLEATQVETFFLNACGSYEEGASLVAAGSRVGAVTYAPIVDRQAARVGHTFVRLLAHGFRFERAMSLARRQIMMGKDYAVIGDGTYRLHRASVDPPTVARASSHPDGTVDVRLDTTPMCDPGALCTVEHVGPPGRRLSGSNPRDRLAPETFGRFLARRRDPVIYDGFVRWPNELRDRLEADA